MITQVLEERSHIKNKFSNPKFHNSPLSKHNRLRSMSYLNQFNTPSKTRNFDIKSNLLNMVGIINLKSKILINNHMHH